jgi:hypothetical protein
VRRGRSSDADRREEEGGTVTPEEIAEINKDPKLRKVAQQAWSMALRAPEYESCPFLPPRPSEAAMALARRIYPDLMPGVSLEEAASLIDEAMKPILDVAPGGIHGSWSATGLVDALAPWRREAKE